MPVCPCGRCARGDLRAVDGKLTKISFFTTSRTHTQQNSIRILEGKATRPADLVSGQAQLCATAAASAGSAECERRSRLAPHSGKTKSKSGSTHPRKPTPKYVSGKQVTPTPATNTLATRPAQVYHTVRPHTGDHMACRTRLCHNSGRFFQANRPRWRQISDGNASETSTSGFAQPIGRARHGQGNRAGWELLHRATGTYSAKEGAAATGRQRKNEAKAAGARVRRGRLPPGTYGARWELALLGKKGARACRAWARHRSHQGGGAGQQAWA